MGGRSPSERESQNLTLDAGNWLKSHQGVTASTLDFQDPQEIWDLVMSEIDNRSPGLISFCQIQEWEGSLPVDSVKMEPVGIWAASVTPTFSGSLHFPDDWFLTNDNAPLESVALDRYLRDKKSNAAACI